MTYFRDVRPVRLPYNRKSTIGKAPWVLLQLLLDWLGDQQSLLCTEHLLWARHSVCGTSSHPALTGLMSISLKEAELKRGSTAEGQVEQQRFYLILEARPCPAPLYSIPANLTEAALGIPPPPSSHTPARPVLPWCKDWCLWRTTLTLSLF